ncbi:hypothetical protein PPL_04849 [Heterostelium album PN500]|uniref:Uncharacterized protein n=1 Tax=Heterostelium pallidum (strain ATCC 26659 / Pp 5 / PN500) TaxID=670386 RepID=D3B8Q6_HETP5|nr:hypothetical protein PPL_04849 [Heterostelium album PN500]EFA82424.1 hypothetical protein PPL_04849 [Heterostelium album PN500]|eukprot:XP_020434541.1 hypothetical protein PPL_04849 [Heterostelium album PN500]
MADDNTKVALATIEASRLSIDLKDKCIDILKKSKDEATYIINAYGPADARTPDRLDKYLNKMITDAENAHPTAQGIYTSTPTNTYKQIHIQPKYPSELSN